MTLGLVRDTPQATSSFRFAHSLTRQSVYETLSASRRAGMHGRVGHALEALPNSRPSELAHHFRAAAPVTGPGPAIRYSLAAAEESMAGLAYEEAVVQYHHALDALRRDPGADLRQQCRVLLATSDACQFAGDKATRGRLALEAARLASREGDAELLGEAARRAPIESNDGEPARSLIVRSLATLPERSALRPRLLRQLAYIEGNSIFHEAAAGTVRAALEAARAVGDADVLIETLESLEHMVPYEPKGHRAITAELFAVAPGANSPLGMLFAHRSRIRDLLHDGDIAGFDAERAQYEVIATRLRYGPSLVSVRRWALARLLLAGDFARAERLLPELLFEAERAGDPLRIVSEFHLRMEQGRLEGLVDDLRDLARDAPQYPWRPRLAAALAEQGRHDEARDQFDDLARHGFAAVRRDLASFVLPLLADVCAELRDRTRADLLYRLLLPFDGRCVVVGSAMYACSGAVARHLGILARTTERWDAAERHLHDALDLHRRMPSPPLVARTHHDLATLYRARAEVGDAARVQSHASECARSAVQLGMRRLAEKVSALIDATPAPPSGLP